ncbi:VanZ family protein [Eubacterium callanderi]|uniref:VanZ family protein n=1 Tax=Eubacterium callanderi TaxID=53442 RepID=A0A853JSA5_9FIRM|nr:VanZ family protein [Eubacterium callanderi]
MLSVYTLPIKFACLVFPVLAAFFTIPYAVYQYRKYGSLLVLRVVIVYSFILYMTCAYFLTMLPLPPIAEVARYTSPTMDLVPFHAWTNFWENTSLVLSDPSTYLGAMKEQCFYEPFFNILLLVPLGVYLRYYFRRSWWQAILIGFLVSLSFELIQLSALFGIYPRPYRLFQVDDLINNTFGALVGFWITPVFSFFLPSRDRLDEVSYKRGRTVTYMRRGFAFLFDWAILTGVLHLAGRVFGSPTLSDMLAMDGKRSVVLYIIVIVLYFILLPWLTRGRTIGKFLVGIRLMSENKRPPKLFQYILRYGLQYLLVIPAPFIAMKVYELLPLYTGTAHTILMVIALAFGLVFAVFIVQLLISVFTRETQIFYESLSHTINVSTVRNGRRKRRQR